MISFIGAEFVQNMMRVVAYIEEEVVVHVSSQLGWCGIVAGVEAKPDSTSYRFLQVFAYQPHW